MVLLWFTNCYYGSLNWVESTYENLVNKQKKNFQDLNKWSIEVDKFGHKENFDKYSLHLKKYKLNKMRFQNFANF